MRKKRSTSTKPTVSVDTFRDDPLYLRIVRAVQKLLARGKVVAPVDILVNMSLIKPEQAEDWRRGKGPFHAPSPGKKQSRGVDAE